MLSDGADDEHEEVRGDMDVAAPGEDSGAADENEEDCRHQVDVASYAEDAVDVGADEAGASQGSASEIEPLEVLDFQMSDEDRLH